MSDFAAVKQAIRARFTSQITDGGDGGAPVPTRLPNTDFTVPSGGVWCDITIRGATNDRLTFGGTTNHYRRTGVLQIACYGPIQKGEADLEALVQRIEVTLRDAPPGLVAFRVPVPGESGVSGKWWKQNLSCPWQATEKH